MNIEEIMKPYFEKKEELEGKSRVNDKLIEERNIINVRLERLRDNKAQEIEEYVKNAVADRPDFYVGYGAMVRKDLEQAYAAKEKQLEEQLIELDEKIQKNSSELERFHRVDVRELVDIKHDLRKKLIAHKKDLELKLKETQINFDTIMFKLSTFKYEYDGNNNVVNGKEYRHLFEESNSLSDLKRNLKSELTKLEEYLKLTEITDEQVNVVMLSMNDAEKAEYNRRKGLSNNAFVDIVQADHQSDDNINESSKQEDADFVENDMSESVENLPLLDNTIDFEEEMIPRLPVASEIEQGLSEIVDTQTFDQSIYEIAKQGMDEASKQEEKYSDFIKTVYTDVLGLAKKLRSVKLSGDSKRSLSVRNETDEEYVGESEVDLSKENGVELPNGSYLYEKDIEGALKNYKKQNKGRVFEINGLRLEVNRETVNNVKKALRDCSIITLLREKKLGIFDIKRIYGKQKSDEYNRRVLIGETKEKMPVGNYINLEEFNQKLKDLFKEKSAKWLEKITAREVYDEVMDADFEPVEDELESLSWDNYDEPEYPVVKAKIK